MQNSNPSQIQSQPLKVLTYNIQVGIETQAYHHYLTRGWRHFLPCASRQKNLSRLGLLLRQYDLVALQETDGGSLRSNHINQVEYLAAAAGFPFWWSKINRPMGKFAQHSLGLLARHRPSEVLELDLPGSVPGRGVILARFGSGEQSLCVVAAHLSLGNRSRQRQLSFLRELIRDEEHVVLMGDMNCSSDELLQDSPLRETSLRASAGKHASYPSWRPRRSLDHILTSSALNAKHTHVLNHRMSDHLPLAAEISVPGNIVLQSMPA